MVVLLTMLGLAGIFGCGSDEGVGAPSSGSGGTGGSGGSTMDSGATDDGTSSASVYALTTEVMADDGSLSYVSILRSLDVGEIDLKKAREFVGRVTIAAHGGSLFVADGETPVVIRFSIGADDTLTETGRVSFLNYGLSTVALDDWGNTFVSPTKAYMIDWASGNQILWNPATLTIAGQVEVPGLVREDWELDGTPGIVRGNRLYRTFLWGSWATYSFSQDQFLAVFDTETDKLVSLVSETRCPALNNRITRDESDNLYFSNWVYNVSATLVSGAPKSCALRLNAGSDTLDPDWVLPYADVTQGHEAAAFVYLQNGQGLIDVFHEERVTIDATTDPLDLALSTNWRIWSLDLTQRRAKPVEGLDWLAGGVSAITLDGRSFVLVPGSMYTRTFGYEVTPDGRATSRFATRGWSSQLIKVH